MLSVHVPFPFFTYESWHQQPHQSSFKTMGIFAHCGNCFRCISVSKYLKHYGARGRKNLIAARWNVCQSILVQTQLLLQLLTLPRKSSLVEKGGWLEEVASVPLCTITFNQHTSSPWRRKKLTKMTNILISKKKRFCVRACACGARHIPCIYACVRTCAPSRLRALS